jgi:hypothetical protein
MHCSIKYDEPIVNHAAKDKWQPLIRTGRGGEICSKIRGGYSEMKSSPEIEELKNEGSRIEPRDNEEHLKIGGRL